MHDQLISLIAESKAQRPSLFDSDRDHPLSEERLQEIEHQFDIQLPESFRLYLKTEGAGNFGFGVIYSPDPQSEWNLWGNYDYMPNQKRIILPFSDNGCGDYYCFPIMDGICQDCVVWADHEQNYSTLSSDYMNFSDFIVSACLNPG